MFTPLGSESSVSRARKETSTVPSRTHEPVSLKALYYPQMTLLNSCLPEITNLSTFSDSVSGILCLSRRDTLIGTVYFRGRNRSGPGEDYWFRYTAGHQG